MSANHSPAGARIPGHSLTGRDFTTGGSVGGSSRVTRCGPEAPEQLLSPGLPRCLLPRQPSEAAPASTRGSLQSPEQAQLSAHHQWLHNQAQREQHELHQFHQQQDLVDILDIMVSSLKQWMKLTSPPLPYQQASSPPPRLSLSLPSQLSNSPLKRGGNLPAEPCEEQNFMHPQVDEILAMLEYHATHQMIFAIRLLT